MIRFFVLIITISISLSGQSQSLEVLSEKSQTAANVIAHSALIPDKAIPLSLLRQARCVGTVPNVIRGGFIFGASYGEGLVSCRVPGGWSDPVFFSVTGGSWGWQWGLESTDLVMVFVNDNAVNRLSKGSLILGGDLTVAAGPLGRDAQLGIDYHLDSEMYSYSTSEGLFFGLTINGTVYKINKDANQLVYGPNTSALDIFNLERTNPEVTGVYVDSLRRYAD